MNAGNLDGLEKTFSDEAWKVSVNDPFQASYMAVALNSYPASVSTRYPPNIGKPSVSSALAFVIFAGKFVWHGLDGRGFRATALQSDASYNAKEDAEKGTVRIPHCFYQSGATNRQLAFC